MNKETEIAWAAGLFEGEGSVSLHTRNGKVEGLSVDINMTDEDVLLKFKKIIGYGVINGPYQRGKNKPHWQVRVHAYEDALRVINMLYPYMGSRRMSRMDEVRKLAAEAKENLQPRGNENACWRGHERLLHSVIDARGQFRCNMCAKIWNKTRYEKAKINANKNS